MHSLALAMFVIPFATDDLPIRMCLIEERIAISEVYSRIRIVGEPTRRSTVRVRLPVDCGNSDYLVPRDHLEAVEWLDVGLPMDLKVALLDGDYAHPYRSSDYGASVMDDLFFHIAEHWNLEEESAVCAAPTIRRRSDPYETPCFYVLVDLLRETYLGDRDQ